MRRETDNKSNKYIKHMIYLIVMTVMDKIKQEGSVGAQEQYLVLNKVVEVYAWRK